VRVNGIDAKGEVRVKEINHGGVYNQLAQPCKKQRISDAFYVVKWPFKVINFSVSDIQYNLWPYL